ncbi:MAG: PorT family protein [Bacteroidales bacterium]|nr:PorT family protein [Bacteroidales bacterium]
MTKRPLKFILTASLLVSITAVTWAQEQDCLSKLDGAEQLFNNGLFEEVPALLENCMELYSETDKKKAYRLIILAHYMNDDVAAAEESMYFLLKEFPDFMPVANDLVDFQYIFNSFSVRRSLDLGVSIGPAWTSGRIIEPFSPFSDKFTYKSNGPGLFAAAYIDIPVSSLFSINTEPGFLLAKYEIRYKDPIAGIYNIEQSETSSLIQLPVYAKVTFLESTMQLYAKAGFMLGYVTGAKTESFIEKINPASGVILYTQPSIQRDHMEYRNRLYYFLGGGAGLKINFKKAYIFTEVDYHVSLNKTLKEGSNRYDQTNLWTQGWIDSDFGLNNLSIRVGMAWSIYTIKKIR